MESRRPSMFDVKIPDPYIRINAAEAQSSPSQSSGDNVISNSEISPADEESITMATQLPEIEPLPELQRVATVPHADTQRHPSQATTLLPIDESEAEKGMDMMPLNTRLARPSNLPLWNARTIVMAILVSLGGLIFGYGGIGQIGGFLAMRDYKMRFGDISHQNGPKSISDTRQGTIVGLLMIGALIGSLIAGKLADKIGRQKSLSIWAMVYILGQIIELTTFHVWYQIAIARMVEGLGIGALSILVPMYQGETAPKEIRGVIISLYQLFITLGILLASLINLGTKNIDDSASWKVTLGVGMIFPLILAIGVHFLDESPRWDIRRNSVDSAVTTIAKLNRTTIDHEYVKQEIQDIRNSVQAESSMSKPALVKMHSEPTIIRRFIVGMVVQAMQQLTGINYFFYFGTQIFAKLDIGDSFVTAVILGVVNFVGTFGGLWVARRFGHRNALTLGGLWIGLNLLCYSFFGHFCVDKECGISQGSVGRAMLAFTCLAIVGFATTWGPLPWVVCAEIFPSRWRAYGMGVSTATNWTFNFLIGFFTPALISHIGYSLGFVFAGAIIVGGLFVHICVHETSGKSLEEIDREILDGVKPWKSKKGV